ncbi:MAG: acetyl-CoA carboxylase, carboxyltransferase subunit beta [bacterium]
MPVEKPGGKKSVPGGLWTKCEKCNEIIYNKELEENLKVCPKCGYYFRLTPKQRIKLLLDRGSFRENYANLKPGDPLEFVAIQSYKNRVKHDQKKTGFSEAVISGEGRIGKYKVAVAILDFDFMGGSMASVVGEKVTRLIEKAIKKRIPVVIVSSSGGARMQEGVLSLMQMAKTSAALGLLDREKLPFISILTNPTTGGVSASFAMLGDVIIAEPRALIGFAGPRVIEQTIRQKLPEGFQTSEFLLKHGLIDMIVERKDLKSTVVRILDLFSSG